MHKQFSGNPELTLAVLNMASLQASQAKTGGVSFNRTGLKTMHKLQPPFILLSMARMQGSETTQKRWTSFPRQCKLGNFAQASVRIVMGPTLLNMARMQASNTGGRRPRKSSPTRARLIPQYMQCSSTLLRLPLHINIEPNSYMSHRGQTSLCCGSTDSMQWPSMHK